ncbi:C4-dicarboxylate ABC transporter [Exilibacterium tricleocarpae]|uniref:C4-dicarboxylate ABC transporter n=1 Tax=Exilibacterium tricleocarpae TaxID=2591008 RepID=A0A545TYU6_9GAMM|nr:Na+/H+ antiporter NhaC family protein [Exilibacterium tricleocarpae]TQV82402.1 C4-dicarboxylate ABC transporter [Exilibacterium tricleocarpae]
MEPGITSLLPPLLAIALAVTTRQIYLSLAAGVWLGYTLLLAGDPLLGLREAIEGLVAVLSNPGDARIAMFTLVIGALIALMERSNGVKGFVDWLEHKRLVAGARSAQWLAWLIGVGIFIESNMTLLVSGAVARPLFDRFRVAREKLAYLIDSTSAPICILIPLNAWGAFNLSLLSDLGQGNALEIFIASIPYNFYAIAAVLLAAATIGFGLNVGPMAAAEKRTREGLPLWPESTPMVDQDLLGATAEGPPAKARNMVVPVFAMVLMMAAGLYITGDGDLVAGSGSTSILWAALFALAIAWILLLAQKAFTMDELTKVSLKGAGGLLPVAIILIFALALGDLTDKLGTGIYVASAIGDSLPPALLLPVVFLLAGIMAFSVGSSWGTFAVMIPIAVPMAGALGLPPAPFLAAVLSGGIFGDHASPISDTTVVASMAAATDHIDHVRTQLPYALASAAIALLAFFVTGLLL